jgi:hypothetical protein
MCMPLVQPCCYSQPDVVHQYLYRLHVSSHYNFILSMSPMLHGGAACVDMQLLLFNGATIGGGLVNTHTATVYTYGNSS